jgi:hypothetical protein
MSAGGLTPVPADGVGSLSGRSSISAASRTSRAAASVVRAPQVSGSGHPGAGWSVDDIAAEIERVPADGAGHRHRPGRAWPDRHRGRSRPGGRVEAAGGARAAAGGGGRRRPRRRGRRRRGGDRAGVGAHPPAERPDHPPGVRLDRRGQGAGRGGGLLEELGDDGQAILADLGDDWEDSAGAGLETLGGIDVEEGS